MQLCRSSPLPVRPDDKHALAKSMVEKTVVLNWCFGFALTTCTEAWGSAVWVCVCPIAAFTWPAILTAKSSVRFPSVCTNSFSRILGQLACSMSWSCIISSVFPANSYVAASSRSVPTYSATVSCGLCTHWLNLCLSTATFIADQKCAHNSVTADSYVAPSFVSVYVVLRRPSIAGAEHVSSCRASRSPPCE